MNLTDTLRYFTIRTRMIGAILVVLALLLVVGGAGLAGMWRNQGLSDEFRHHSFAEVQELSHMRAALGQVRRHEKQMLLQSGQGDVVLQSAKAWQASVDELQAKSSEMLQGEEDEDNPIVRSLQASLKEYNEAYQAKIQDLASGALTGADALTQLSAATAKADTLDNQLSEIEKILLAEAGETEQAQESAVKYTMAAFVVAVAVAMLVVAPLTLLNMVSICHPLEQARRLAQAIAQGDLRTQLRVGGQDEASDLLKALLHMQASVQTIVSDIRNSAESISVASNEIASGNMDLSTRTESTASSLQQTASSMEQLTGTVRQSADAASQANQLARGAADAAHRGSDIVANVVTSMEDIDSISRRINDIISVIDGIAFQTNILALNAAVEAARAGDQVRGFAVVATEVRSLAQRSAAAAREIKDLIGDSVGKVSSGTTQVQRAGKTMQDILTAIAHVNEIVSEISSASIEQTQGIEQVSTTITHMDQTTQQNAALVEEATAAARRMEQQARDLQEAVSVFRW